MLHRTNDSNDLKNNIFAASGRVFAVGTLAVCYIYSSEIFPTVVRNVGLGSCSVWARVGPMVSSKVDNCSIVMTTLNSNPDGCKKVSSRAAGSHI
jgi:hypothetical protein